MSSQSTRMDTSSGSQTTPAQPSPTGSTGSMSRQSSTSSAPSRDLLQFESSGPISPFLITPASKSSAAATAFPFPPLSTSSSSSPTSSLAAGALSPSISIPGEKPRPRTFAVQPPSALLARVAAFLPQMAKANEVLEQQVATHGADSVNIESVSDSGAPHIEMNLDVGVLEMQKRTEQDDAKEIIIPGVNDPSALLVEALNKRMVENAMQGQQPEDSDEDDDDDEDDEEASSGTTTTNSSSASAAAPVSRSARKKQKYRVRAREKKAASVTGEASQSLPKPNNPLIQVMED